MKLYWDNGENIDMDIINESEKKTGYELPGALKAILVKHDGAMLKKDIDGNQDCAYVEVNNIGRVSVQLKRHRILPNYSNSEYVNDFELYQENLPNGFIAFAHDAGDNIFILDSNKSGDTSKVYYLLIEESLCREDLEDEGFAGEEIEEQLKQSLILVADSFDTLIASVD